MDDIDLAVEARTEGDWSVVDVTGEIDMSTAPKLASCIDELVSEGSVRIVVNLGGVEFMDSTGLNTLVTRLARVRGHKGTIALACPSKPVARLLSLTRLDGVFSIYPSVADATEAQDG